MKKSLIKVFSLLVTAVMAFTLCCVPASAGTFYGINKVYPEKIQTISSDKTYKFHLDQYGFTAYKFTAAKTGELKLKITVNCDDETLVALYSSDGKPVCATSKEGTDIAGAGFFENINGSGYASGCTVSGSETCTATYFITPGTYYLGFITEEYYGSDVSFTAKFPEKASSSDNIKELTSGKATKYTYYESSTGNTVYTGKITSKSAGKLKLRLSTETPKVFAIVYDEQGNPLTCTEKNTKTEAVAGIDMIQLTAVSGTPCDTTLTYEIGKGTYYLFFMDNTSWGGSDLYVTATVTPDSAANKQGYITYTLKKGSSVQLGTEMASGSDKEVVWSSSNRKAVTVSTSGKITAKDKGVSFVTATAGKNSMKIKVVVK